MAKLTLKRKFINRGLLYAELNEFLARDLANVGYSGCVCRIKSSKTDIIIHCTDYRELTNSNNRRINELTSMLKQRFGFKTLRVFARDIAERSLSAQAQAEQIRAKLAEGVSVRKACYGSLRAIKRAGALGAEVIVSGKARAQRAKAMKYTEGVLLKTGQTKVDYIESATRHLVMKQGVLGIKVAIMLPKAKTHTAEDPKMIPDHIEIREPKADETSNDVPMAVFSKTEEEA
ncbi:hypothetical protein PCE1_002444 [Barthelona sp. PCE]